MSGKGSTSDGNNKSIKPKGGNIKLGALGGVMGGGICGGASGNKTSGGNINSGKVGGEIGITSGTYSGGISGGGSYGGINGGGVSGDTKSPNPLKISVIPCIPPNALRAITPISNTAPVDTIFPISIFFYTPCSNSLPSPQIRKLRAVALSATAAFSQSSITSPRIQFVDAMSSEYVVKAVLPVDCSVPTIEPLRRIWP